MGLEENGTGGEWNWRRMGLEENGTGGQEENRGEGREQTRRTDGEAREATREACKSLGMGTSREDWDWSRLLSH